MKEKIGVSSRCEKNVHTTVFHGLGSGGNYNAIRNSLLSVKTVGIVFISAPAISSVKSRYLAAHRRLFSIRICNPYKCKFMYLT